VNVISNSLQKKDIGTLKFFAAGNANGETEGLREYAISANTGFSLLKASCRPAKLDTSAAGFALMNVE